MSSDSALDAFRRVEFHWVFDLRQVWSDRPVGHLPLQEEALKRFRNSLEHALRIQPERAPLGLCFAGPAGAGKTHLLGEIRREAAQNGANFVLSDLTDVRDFWPLLAMHFLQSIQREMNGVRQLQRILEVLLRQVDDPPGATEFIARGRYLPREGLLYFTDRVIESLLPIYGKQLSRRSGVFRALMYLESDDTDLSDRAYSFLQGVEQIGKESRLIGLDGPNSPKQVVIDLAWFLSLTGPTVLAFDQLDPFVAQNNLGELQQQATPRLAEAMIVLSDVVNGIFAVREECARTLVVLSCLESSWKVLQKRAVQSFQDRFEVPENLRPIRDRSIPSELVALRLDEGYREADFMPPYRTWPFAPGFFNSLPPGLTPREILNRCEKHRLDCVRSGTVTELDHYSDNESRTITVDLTHLDKLFSRLVAAIDTKRLLDEHQEEELGDLLGAAAHIFRRELPHDPDVDFAVECDFHETRKYESLHLRMRRIFHSQGEREEHVCVRVLQKSHARSFQVRLGAALTTSGMSERLDGRRLFLLRSSELPAGPVSRQTIKDAKQCGAAFLQFGPADVRAMAAAVELSKTGDPLFETWLLQNRPLSKTWLFQQLAANWIEATDQVKPPSPSSLTRNTATNASRPPDPAERPALIEMKANPPRQRLPPEPTAPEAIKAQPVSAESIKAEPANAPSAHTEVQLGLRLEAGSPGDPVFMPLVDLTRHVLIRAGAGGGKTVFIKRVVEEAALCGISSIVIDTAKDLSMLGDTWPQPPVQWSSGDAELAQRYHRDVDVRLWTPGHSGGKPLRLAPLPNLSGPFAEAYDREQVIQVAVSGLLPLAVQKKNHNVEKAILTEVVSWLTRQPPHTGEELTSLIAALRDLPGECCKGYQNERKLANGMADQVQATLVADPLYGGQGEYIDPGMLFGVGLPRPRVSILSLIGMPDIDTRARFIGQLASLLFNWIRRNPAPAGSAVRGLLVLDEAARFLPRGNAESKPGLMLLAREARKYGLGLVMATQNPMDLDYNAPANFATQLFGIANVPQVVKFIQEAMEQRGLSGLNPGTLKPGEFFCATPSLLKPMRVQGLMCLSAHPHNVQLSEDDILARALRNA